VLCSWTAENRQFSRSTRGHCISARNEKRAKKRTRPFSQQPALEVGHEASEFTRQALAKPFTIQTRWRLALGRSKLPRYYAIVVTADGRDLNELLVSAGLARIYGTRTPLPDGRDSREYLVHLDALENEARAAKRGRWVVQP
jgi:endonuclease YncB( thermonuclease family)